MTELRELEGVDHAAIRAMACSDDQRISPYVATPWTSARDSALVPNRLLGVDIRRAG